MKTKAVVENGFKETEIGLIPEDWEVVNVDKYIQFERGTEPGSENYNKDKKGVRFLRVVDISGSRDDKIYTTSKKLKLCKKKDILITFDGSPGIVKQGLEGAYSSGIRKVVIINKDLFSDYVYYVLRTIYVQRTIEKYTTGVTIKHSSKAILHIKIPFFSIQEQQKIAFVLSKIQQAIEQQDKIIETTKELKKSLMQKLFTEGLHGEEQKETEIGLMPKSWEVKCINEISDKLLGGGTPSTKISEYWNGNIHWTTSKKLGEQIYLFDGEKKITEQGVNNSSTSLIPKNNLLISTRVSVGKVVVNKEDIAISQDLTGTIINKKLYNAEFLAYQIKTIRIQKIFDEQKRGATIKGITREDLKGIKLTVPDLKEQTKIAVILLCLDKKLQQAESKKQTLQALFRTMLNQLMTGKVRVKDFDFEVKN